VAGRCLTITDNKTGERPANQNLRDRNTPLQILEIRPAPPGDGRYRTLAHFDAELTDSIRIYGMRLLEADNGRRLTYAPSSGGRRFATFAPALIAEITAAANAAYDKGHATANDRHSD